jgi:uncharacterized protein (DUF362 family)
MNRREFIKKAAKLGVMAGAASLLSPYSKLMALDKKGNKPALAAVKNSTPEGMFDAGIAALGGMTKFVKKGQTVVVKPNIGWDTEPELAGDTNPNLVARIIKHCYDAGAKKVYVFDHTCDPWKETYATSGIEAAAKKAGASVVPGNTQDYYQKVSVPGAKTLKTAKVHELILSSDVFINVPILKNHGSAGLTMAMKNLMGIVWERGVWHATGLQQCIADFTAYRKPDLNVIDCYRIMTQNGPRGTSKADTQMAGSQIISSDIVAADAAAAKIFGTDPASVGYIKLAAEKGLGVMDLNEVDIKKVYL